MARSRNIKPSFFDNDELAELDPLARLLFIGLWTLADFAGNLEWRTKRIKKQLLAYDDCDIEQLAINLDKSGFIRFYSDGQKIYLNIVNFSKHQNPHKNERQKGSEIPTMSDEMRQAIDLKELTINRDKSGLILNDSDTNRADSLNLIPDSLNLIPDSSNKDTSSSAKNDAVPYEKIRTIFNEVMPEPFPRVKVLSTARKTQVKKLFGLLKKDVGKVQSYFQYFADNCSDFHKGGNDRGWVADFDYIIREKTLIKAQENTL